MRPIIRVASVGFMLIFFLSHASSMIPGEDETMSFAKGVSSGKSVGGRTQSQADLSE